MKRSGQIPKLRFKEFINPWNCEFLENLAKRGSGHTPNKKYNSYYNGNIKWVSLADSKYLDNGYINETTYQISEEGLKNSSAVLHNEGSVLLSRDAGIGKSAVMKSQMAVSQHFIVWKPYEDKLNNWFLYYTLQIYKPEFERIAIGSTIKTIGLPYFKKLKIKIPKLEEQQKIASFLSSIDKKIKLLKEKKDLLEQYKKGVMQQIFSQQIRFKPALSGVEGDDDGKDFPDWEKHRIDELFKDYKGTGIPKGDIYEAGENDCVLYGELYTKYNEVISEVVSKTNSSNGLKSKMGDLLIPTSTTTQGIDLANVTALNFENVLLGGDIMVLRAKKKSDNIFYAYYLSNHMKNEIAKRAQGITIIHLYFSGIRDLMIDYPSYAEQLKIGEFLNSIDEKIELINSQLENTQIFKKGLLQQMFV